MDIVNFVWILFYNLKLNKLFNKFSSQIIYASNIYNIWIFLWNFVMLSQWTFCLQLIAHGVSIPCSSLVSVSVFPPVELFVSPSSVAVPLTSFCAPPTGSRANAVPSPPSPTTELSWPLRGIERVFSDAACCILWQIFIFVYLTICLSVFPSYVTLKNP